MERINAGHYDESDLYVCKQVSNIRVINDYETDEPFVYAAAALSHKIHIKYDENEVLFEHLPYYAIETNLRNNYLKDMDNFGHLLASCGSAPVVDIMDVKERGRIIKTLHLPEHLRYRSTALRFTANGQYLFLATEEFEGPTGAITMWDVETGSCVHEFKHPKRSDCEEIAGYEQHKSFKVFRYEMFDVCPTSNGNHFVSSSYTDLFHWDTRSGQLVKTVQFLSEPETAIKVAQPQNDKIRLQLIKNETELLVNNHIPGKTTTFSVHDLVPTYSQFSSNFFNVYVDNFKGVGHRTDGELCLIDCLNKEDETLLLLKKPPGWFNSSGHINSSGDTIALSSGNENLLIVTSRDIEDYESLGYDDSDEDSF